MILLSLDDEAFLSSIHDEELRAKYRKRLRDELAKVRKQLRLKRKKFRDDQYDGIADNEMHDQIINMAVYPFIEKTRASEQLGYSLRYCDPLRELGYRNFDFLIAKKGKKRVIAIFGEAKTTRLRAESIANEIRAKQRIVEENIPYIRKAYLEDTSLPVDVEYVITVFPGFVDDIQDALEQSFEAEDPPENTKIIIWKTDDHDSTLDIANPGKANHHKLRMLHADNALNEALKNLEVPRKARTFFPQSHPATQIKALIRMLEYIKATTGKLEFTVPQVDDFIANELYYMDIEGRQALRETILKNAEQIGFIENKGFGQYDVKKEYAGASLKGETVERLLVNTKIKEDQDKKIKECRRNVQDEILAEAEKRPTMEKYFTSSQTRNEERSQQP